MDLMDRAFWWPLGWDWFWISYWIQWGAGWYVVNGLLALGVFLTFGRKLARWVKS